MQSFTEDLNKVMEHLITYHEGCPISVLGNGKCFALHNEWNNLEEAKQAINRALSVLNKITIVK